MNEEQKAFLRKGVEYVEAQEQLPVIERNWWQAAWHLSEKDWHEYRVYAARAAEAKQAEVSYDQVEQPELAACGSAHCLFGYLAEVDGQDWRSEYNGEESGDLTNGQHVREYIRDRLGLSDEQAEDLSAPANDAAKIRRLAEEYAGERL